MFDFAPIPIWQGWLSFACFIGALAVAYLNQSKLWWIPFLILDTSGFLLLLHPK